MILFIGSVFSPRYFAARHEEPGGSVSPDRFCAVNLALYGQKPLWVMSEYGPSRLRRDPDFLHIGGTQARWEGDRLVIDLCEQTKPFFQRMPGRITGRISLWPNALFDEPLALDALARHTWSPIAPSARFAVELSEPALSYSGHAYFDTNSGAEPLERAFRSWTWSRSSVREGTAITYDVNERSGREHKLTMLYRKSGVMEPIQAPRVHPLPPTIWGIPRQVRTQSAEPARLQKTLESAPFYARSLVDSTLFGQRAETVHETLDMNRFMRTWVRFLLPFRIRKSRS